MGTPTGWSNSEIGARSNLQIPTGVAGMSRPGQRALEAHLGADGPQANLRRGARIPAGLLRVGLRLSDGLVIGLVCALHLQASGTLLMEAQLQALLPYIAMAIVTLTGLSVSGAWHVEARGLANGRAIQAANICGMMLIIAVLTMSRFWPHTAIHVAAPLALLLWLSLNVLHFGFSLLVAAFVRSGRMSENVVIVGATSNARKLIARNAATRELNIVGVFDDRLSRAPTDIEGVPVLGRIEDLMSWQDLPNMDRIVVTVTSEARERVRSLVDRLRILPQRIVLLLDLAGFDPETESLSQIANSPAAYISGRPQDLGRILIKRAADIVFSLGLLIAFSPLLAVIAAAIRLEGPGPIFFRQRRHGFNNQIIRVWKFRSMKPDRAAEIAMTAQTFAGDTRVTRVGRIIRKYSLDELPQLINVLRGEMSLVGPRPHAVGMTTEQTEVHAIVGDYAHRHRVKPGLTGWAQVHGSRGPVHTKEEMRERVRLDLEYVNRASFWLDLYIMLMTAPCLLGDRKAER